MSPVSELQSQQYNLQTLLSNAQTTERETHNNLNQTGEELAELRRAHAREVEELDATVRRKEREKRNMEEELQEARDELSRERETVRGLKVSLDTSQITHLPKPKGEKAR